MLGDMPVIYLDVCAGDKVYIASSCTQTNVYIICRVVLRL